MEWCGKNTLPPKIGISITVAKRRHPNRKALIIIAVISIRTQCLTLPIDFPVHNFFFLPPNCCVFFLRLISFIPGIQSARVYLSTDENRPEEKKNTWAKTVKWIHKVCRKWSSTMSDRLFILCIQYENANKIANDIIKLHIYPYRRLFLLLRAALLSTGGIKERKKLRIASMKLK